MIEAVGRAGEGGGSGEGGIRDYACCGGLGRWLSFFCILTNVGTEGCAAFSFAGGPRLRFASMIPRATHESCDAMVDGGRGGLVVSLRTTEGQKQQGKVVTIVIVAVWSIKRLLHLHFVVPRRVSSTFEKLDFSCWRGFSIDRSRNQSVDLSIRQSSNQAINHQSISRPINQ